MLSWLVKLEEIAFFTVVSNCVFFTAVLTDMPSAHLIYLSLVLFMYVIPCAIKPYQGFFQDFARGGRGDKGLKVLHKLLQAYITGLVYRLYAEVPFWCAFSSAHTREIFALYFLLAFQFCHSKAVMD